MLLKVQDLCTDFATERGDLRAVDHLSFELPQGKALALVGESGCGKSVTALSLLSLVRRPGRVTAGYAEFFGVNLLSMPNDELRKIRGREIGMIFQEPMTSLNPVLTVGEQIGEVLSTHFPELKRQEVVEKCVAMLKRVGIAEPVSRFFAYPHELSGGMRQRVMIAMALACEPRLLIADEPTTALDVTVQSQILDLIRELRREIGMAVLLITHDLGVVSEQVDEVAVMYAGVIVERAPKNAIFADPLHPYTQGLMDAIPGDIDGGGAAPRTRLRGIEGNVPRLGDRPSGCRFRDRCPIAKPHCADREPPLEEKRAGHWARCFEVKG